MIKDFTRTGILKNVKNVVYKLLIASPLSSSSKLLKHLDLGNNIIDR